MPKFLYLFILLPVLCKAQSPRDSILTKERSIDRPITLHGGQLRIEGGYGLSAITKRYDVGGDAIHIRDEGLSYVRHAYFLDVRYGIVENLQINIATAYKRQSQRNEQVLTFANSDFTQLFEIRNKKGIEDLLIALSGRAPFTSKALDLIVTAGIYLPVGSDDDKRPDHSAIVEGGDKDITYRYQSAWGNGTKVTTLGGVIKYRGEKYAFTGSAIYDYPLKESSNVQWQHQFINGKFEYQSQRYAYQLPGYLNLQLELEKQLAPWFDLSLLFRGESAKGGWTEINGEKVSRSKSALYSFNPGYEILVTPKIWLRQRLFFSLSGKNSEAPFTVNTSLVYNFFPFNK